MRVWDTLVRRGESSAGTAGRDAAKHQESVNGLAGDSFEDLFVRYEQKIFNLILRLVGNYEEAADLTSETFVQALKGLPNFRRQSQPYTWLYRIAVNLCKNHFRYNAHRARHHAFSLDQGRETDGDDSSIDIEDHRHEPGRLFETLEIQQHVEKAIAALPAEMRMTVVLRDLQGLSYQEIADVLDCSLEAVKSRLFRARAALREQLRPFIQTKDE